jgi:hypothetical protein
LNKGDLNMVSCIVASWLSSLKHSLCKKLVFILPEEVITNCIFLACSKYVEQTGKYALEITVNDLIMSRRGE